MTIRAQPWRQFERLVTEIQRQLAPQAEVRASKAIVGKSGEVRRVDVAVRERVGVIPVLIVFDCKRHRRPVSIEHVGAFAAQRADVGADVGVMISDWRALVGTEAWTFLTLVELEDVTATADVGGQDVEVMLSLPILDRTGAVRKLLRDMFWEGGRSSRLRGCWVPSRRTSTYRQSPNPSSSPRPRERSGCRSLLSRAVSSPDSGR